jgi:hypothetical protein
LTPAWVHLVDLSLATAIGAGAAYSMFRLYASTEEARRGQMGEFVKLLLDQVTKRQDELIAEVKELRLAAQALRDEIRHGRR